MKNILLLIIGTLCVVSSIAQPTLTGATINPVAGDKFYEHDFDTAGISKGASGPGVTWNFSGTGTPVSDSAIYLDCAGTPFCDSFPGSTLATFDGSDYTYYTADASKFAFSGVGEFAGAGGSCVYFPDLQNILNYPTAYSSVTVDTYYSSQPVFQTYTHGVDSFIADAYGTLILPSGTYSNVLRVRMVEYETDSFYLSSSMWVVDSSKTDYYFWYQPGFHNPLLFMEYDTSGGTEFLSDAIYYSQDNANTHTAGVTSVVHDAQIFVYPNPANGQLHIKFISPTSQLVWITATDIIGRAVAPAEEQNITEGANEINYDVAALPPGMYYLKIQGALQTIVKKILISR